MTTVRRDMPSAWRLRADLLSAHVLIWVGSVGRDAVLSPETHLYLASRYELLSHHYVRRRQYLEARRLARLAAGHYRAGGWDGPPYAGALALPAPERRVIVNAISRARVSSADVA